MTLFDIILFSYSAQFHSFILAFTFGDPHIRTLDGHTYTFNGVGDYILFTVKNSTEFIIHSRMSKARISQNSSISESKATVFSGFAMKTDQGALVEFYLNVTSMFQKLYSTVLSKKLNCKAHLVNLICVVFIIISFYFLINFPYQSARNSERPCQNSKHIT